MYQPAEQNLLHTENIFKDAVHLSSYIFLNRLFGVQPNYKLTKSKMRYTEKKMFPF